MAKLDAPEKQYLRAKRGFMGEEQRLLAGKYHC